MVRSLVTPAEKAISFTWAETEISRDSNIVVDDIREYEEKKKKKKKKKKKNAPNRPYEHLTDFHVTMILSALIISSKYYILVNLGLAFQPNLNGQ